MHVLRDSASIRGAVTNLPVLSALIARRIEELSEYGDYELEQLVNVVIVEPRDLLSEVDAAVGFSLEQRDADAIEAHPGWTELTFVVRDDGFGYVVYVPDGPAIDPQLRAVCEVAARSAAKRAQ